MQIHFAPGITLDMSQNGTRTVTKPKLAEDIRDTQEAIERLEVERHKKLYELAEIESMISGAQGRLLQLRGETVLQERAGLVGQRQKMRGRYEGRRWK
jgi:hypothetical protein